MLGNGEICLKKSACRRTLCRALSNRVGCCDRVRCGGFVRRVCAESLCEGLGIDPEKRKQSPWEWFLSVGNRCLRSLGIGDAVSVCTGNIVSNRVSQASAAGQRICVPVLLAIRRQRCYGADLTRRNPRYWMRFPGAAQSRMARRVHFVSLPHDPPRITRPIPETAPVGSVAGSAS